MNNDKLLKKLTTGDYTVFINSDDKWYEVDSKIDGFSKSVIYKLIHKIHLPVINFIKSTKNGDLTKFMNTYDEYAEYKIDKFQKESVVKANDYY